MGTGAGRPASHGPRQPAEGQQHGLCYALGQLIRADGETGGSGRPPSQPCLPWPLRLRAAGVQESGTAARVQGLPQRGSRNQKGLGGCPPALPKAENGLSTPLASLSLDFLTCPLSLVMTPTLVTPVGVSVHRV